MKSFFNQTPLTQNSRASLSLGKIKPEGWLLKQLLLQAEGITGKLDEFWPWVGKECKWAGGNGDGWERAPYYLDGLVVLAYLLDDEKLKKKAQVYLEWIIASQRKDGWFGPEGNEDYWPLMVALKAEYSYFTATGDKRVLLLMDRFFKYELANLREKPFTDWAVARGGDNIYLAIKLYNITGQKYLLDLCKLLKEQTLDWTNIFHTFPNVQAMSKAMPIEKLQNGLANENKHIRGEERPFYANYFHQTHGVNVAMGLKTPGAISTFKSGFKEQGGFRFGWEKLMKHHGVANGIYTCDEHINGTNPSAGTETCTVMEALYSIETLMDMGDFGNDLPDVFEKLAYNTLPAPFSPDTMLHQYLQQTNQIAATDGKHSWYNNSADANTFGLEPNYGCCTANCHQGWPKFAASLWYATNDEGLSAVTYAPCSVNHTVSGKPVKLTVKGQYPFDETVEINVKTKEPVEFPLYLRIPFWTVNPVICLPNGEIMTVNAGETACIRQKWSGDATLKLILSRQPRITKWSHQSAAVEVGPLLMSLNLDYDEKITKELFGIKTHEYSVKGDWAYALDLTQPMKLIYTGEEAEGFKIGSSPLKVCAKVIPCPQWQKEGEDAGPIPILPKCDKSSEITVELIPYGYTTLRISQFPVDGNASEN